MEEAAARMASCRRESIVIRGEVFAEGAIDAPIEN
jgi:hypothetical protein